MSKRWLEFSVKVSFEYVEPVFNIFSKYSDNKVVLIETKNGLFGENESLIEIVGWIDYDSEFCNNIKLIEISLSLINQLSPIGELQKKIINDEGWKNQTFSPIRVGENLIISPHLIERPNSSDIVIPLNPGLSFGTGYHPTTRMCLESLEQNLTINDVVLDLGSGSGILSIASFMLGASKVISFDTDDDAIKSTKENISQAKISGNSLVINGTLPNHNISQNSQDITVANISSRVIIFLSKHLIGSIKSDGLLIVSGILDDTVFEVIRSLEKYGGNVHRKRKIDDWNLLEIRTS